MHKGQLSANFDQSFSRLVRISISAGQRKINVFLLRLVTTPPKHSYISRYRELIEIKAAK